jgi:hypothetical protein
MIYFIMIDLYFMMIIKFIVLIDYRFIIKIIIKGIFFFFYRIEEFFLRTR